MNKAAIPSGCNPDCPACPHRRWTETESLQQKQGFLLRTLEPWQAVVGEVCGVHGMERWGYRRQAVLHASWQDGWTYGLRRRDDIVPIPDCPVHNEDANQALRLLAGILPGPDEFPLAFFVLSGAQLVMVLKTATLPSGEIIPEGVFGLLQGVGIEGLWVHLHPSAGKRVFGKGGWHLLHGRARSRDGNGMLYGPASFQQLIPSLYEASMDMAASFLAPDGSSAVVDLYSGTGTSTRRWVALGAATIGVEWSGEAVECARENVPDALILRGLCRDRLPQLTPWMMEQKEKGRRPLLYANPPRTGMEPEVIAWITDTCRPERIAYLSCSAGTLRRDLLLLEQGGYEVRQLQPYDFFPQTRHVECLALLSHHHRDKEG